MSELLALPVDCIAAIISFTSPRDACRFASVSTLFRSAAESDAVWGQFLPSEHVSAIAESGTGPSSSSTKSSLSKKELYLRACHEPVLIDQGKLSFWLDKPSGKKCYMISPRVFKPVWTHFPYWHLISLPDARFPEVAKLKFVHRFEIYGEISTSLLSPETTYVAYLVFRPIDGPYGSTYGFNDTKVEVSVGLFGSEGQKRIVCLDVVHQVKNPDFFPKKRGDGWWETELGEIFNCGDRDGEMTTSITENKRGNLKHGIVFQGIEIRPKKE